MGGIKIIAALQHLISKQFLDLSSALVMYNLAVQEYNHIVCKVGFVWSEFQALWMPYMETGTNVIQNRP